MGSRKLTILYGSQTGTAQEVAERIWRESKRFHFHGPIQAMDEYLVTQLIYEKIVIFVCSTTGQGEVPDNMKRFWKFLLRRNLPSDSLNGLRYSILGLGDSSYSEFNFAAKKLNRRLLQLGGQLMKSVGLADDQHDLGYSAVVDPWVATLFTNLMDLNPLPNGLELLSTDFLIPPRWQISLAEPGKEKITSSEAKAIALSEKGAIGIVNDKSKVDDDMLETEKKIIDSGIATYNKKAGVEMHPRSIVAVEYSQLNPCLVTVMKNTRTTAQSHFQNKPVIMIGPGTGVAPFRSYIHERVALRCASKDVLFLMFGCRNKNGDYHCQDEWAEMITRRQLKMLCAFSRDQEHKIYVQHLIKDCSHYLWELISTREAHIFLAGSSKNMPAAVRDALIFDVLVEQGSMEIEQAKSFLEKYGLEGKFQSETWS